MWLRAHDLHNSVTFQTDWSQEFGGDNPTRITLLPKRWLHPLGGDLSRYPLGRKGYNDRVERSHHTDDEEFYRPYLRHAKDNSYLLSLAQSWAYFCIVIRRDSGRGINGKPPLEVLGKPGYNGPATVRRPASHHTR